ncbi:uncharacterized protein TM35_000421380 [Trypanosoma theileri]|uniref:Uncharacterized protein n=1 Tax=Trypanosoma theileri TaxID=67003 RepID=A0A1X0NKP3_9TRYP|nr:uncharacterized protein TM35_000421380 [Trypanosoma theileri]ORC84680.1 hypothetical protein TM35_000421380 [Trypanosoma theileri]
MWKQDIGQWVERKGRRGLTGGEQQQQQQTRHLTTPTRHAGRAGFLPEGFKERPEDIPTASAIPTDFSSLPKTTTTTTTTTNPSSLQEGGTSHAGECWVAVYGVSAGSILDVREYLDIMFGRTVEHACPRENGMVGKSHILQVGNGTNWFYVKFENSVAAARAVYQSPLTIPILTGGYLGSSAIGTSAIMTTSRDSVGSNNVNVKQEIVGVAWCNDATFLQEHEQKNIKETEEFIGKNPIRSSSIDNNNNNNNNINNNMTSKGKSPVQDLHDDTIKNAAGVTPCGADRLNRTRLPTSHSVTTTTTNANANANANVVNEMGTTRGSRGLGSLLRDALYSPWSMRWTTSRPSYSEDTSPLPKTGGASILASGGRGRGGVGSSSTDRTEVFHESFQSPDHKASVWNNNNNNNNNNNGMNAPLGSGSGKQQNSKDRTGSIERDIHSPTFLFSRSRQEYFDTSRQVNSAVPVPPLPGNLSILSAFRADVSQRRLPHRIIRLFINLPSYISHRLTSHTFHDSNLQDITTVDTQWNSIFGGCSIEQRYGQQRRLLRHRHYNAAARLHTENGGTGESSPSLMYWAPLRWYESTTVFSLIVFLLLLFLLSAVSSIMVSTTDMVSSDRWSSGATLSSSSSSAFPTEVDYGIRKIETAEVPPVGQVQGTIFADGGYRSNLYQARTL